MCLIWLSLVWFGLGLGFVVVCFVLFCLCLLSSFVCFVLFRVDLLVGRLAGWLVGQMLFCFVGDGFFGRLVCCIFVGVGAGGGGGGGGGNVFFLFSLFCCCCLLACVRVCVFVLLL